MDVLVGWRPSSPGFRRHVKMGMADGHGVEQKLWRERQDSNASAQRSWIDHGCRVRDGVGVRGGYGRMGFPPPEGSLEGHAAGREVGAVHSTRPSSERRGRSSRVVGGDLAHGACWLRHAARLPLHRRCTTGASWVELKAMSRSGNACSVFVRLRTDRGCIERPILRRSPSAKARARQSAVATRSSLTGGCVGWHVWAVQVGSVLYTGRSTVGFSLQVRRPPTSVGAVS
jgi:hypothetical protein